MTQCPSRAGRVARPAACVLAAVAAAVALTCVPARAAQAPANAAQANAEQADPGDCALGIGALRDRLRREGDPSGVAGRELRTLLASARVLSRHGRFEDCASVLSLARQIDPRADRSQVATGDATAAPAPVAADPTGGTASAPRTEGAKHAWRAEQLVGTTVVDLDGSTLGSVDDLIREPGSGAIRYLVVGYGGLFGTGERRVPVPWHDFRATDDPDRLVLGASQSALDAAPELDRQRFVAGDAFDAAARMVDGYWRRALPR
ncbi:MAG: PRC-barrel domain-containing protein [Lautropia sp.]